LLKHLVESSLRYRTVVLVLAIALIVYGIYVTENAKLDVFPDFVPPQVSIQTEAPGLSPEQVESLITTPVENAIKGVGNLESVRSQSIQGLSIITAVFTDGTDILSARQQLGERLAESAAQLPQGTSPPRMGPLTSSTMDLLKIGLVSDRLSPMDLRTFADWTVRPRLLAIPGVASVLVYGGEVRQLQVQVRPERLVAYDLSTQDVLNAARSATGIRGAGFVESAAQRVILRTEGQSLTPEELGQAVVATRSGQSIRLADVADVALGGAPKFGDAMIQGRPGVLMPVLSQYGANTLEVTRAIEAALKEMQPLFKTEGVTVYPDLFRPASFIESAIHNIGHSLLIGGLLVTIVLFLFLWNIRAALISITAIPLSLLVAVIILQRFGLTLNTITLGGLAIAIGEVVDDAIIDVENIFRRLRENAAAGQPRSAFRVVLDASLEVRSAVVYATLIVVLVFVPVLGMSGIQGRLFAPLGIAYILAVLASLAKSLTVTPAMCLVLLPSRAARRSTEPALIAAFKRAYTKFLSLIVERPAVVIVPVVLICVLAVGVFRRLGSEFLPEFREGHFVMQMNAVPGTSLAESRRVGKLVADDLLENPHFRTVPQQIGRAELGEDTWGPHKSEFHINLAKDLDAKEEDQAQSELRETLAKYPGMQFEVTTFLGDRIGETISGETAAVVINIFGDDLDTLDQKAQEVAGAIGKVPGAVDVKIGSPPGAPQIAMRLRPERLREFGFRPVDVLDALQTAYQGTTAAQTYEGSRVFDVVVILDEADRQDPESVGQLMLRNGDGGLVRLNELADVYTTTGRYMLLHDDGRRRQTVTCNVRGRDVTSFVNEARKLVEDSVSFPKGTYAAFTGAAEARAAAQHELLMHSGIAAIGIVLLLYIVAGNVPNLLLILINLPFALVGGILAVFLSSNHNVSIGSLVGFVTLFGITTRNSIMLISHYQHLVRHEGMTWNRAAALRGASERIVPILMTALVTGLGLLPIALGSGQAGRVIEGPMAIVILGGLATSTILNLLVLPTLALRFGRFAVADEEGDEADRVHLVGGPVESHV
jgi:CzcA family heavy metal efflux pump